MRALIKWLFVVLAAVTVGCGSAAPTAPTISTKPPVDTPPVAVPVVVPTSIKQAKLVIAQSDTTALNAAGTELKFSSSDESIATVSLDGVVSGRKAGIASITATGKGGVATVKAVVLGPPAMQGAMDCPSVELVTLIDAAITLDFSKDPASVLCSPKSGERVMSIAQARMYHALAVFGSGRFGSLMQGKNPLQYAVDAGVSGLGITTDSSYYNVGTKVVSIKLPMLAIYDPVFASVYNGENEAILVSRFAHEFWHSTFGGHRCQITLDCTLAEGGPWAVEVEVKKILASRAVYAPWSSYIQEQADNVRTSYILDQMKP